MIQLHTLLRATVRALRRYSGKLLAAAVLPFAMLFGLRLLDRYVLHLQIDSQVMGQGAFNGNLPAAFNSQIVAYYLWDLFYWLPTGLFAAAVIRIVLSGGRPGHWQRFGWPLQSDGRFVLNAFIALVCLAPVLLGLRFLGDGMMDWMLQSQIGRLQPDFLTAWATNLLRLLLGSASLWWVFLVMIGFRLAALAEAKTTRANENLLLPTKVRAVLLAVCLCLWFCTELPAQILFLQFPMTDLFPFAAALDQAITFLQVGLYMTAIAIAYDVARKGDAP